MDCGKLRFDRKVVAGLIFFSTLIGLHAADLNDIKPLEPEVAKASTEGKEAMDAIRIPKGWKISLFAAEPDVANIVAIDVDHQGRMYVVESFRQNKGVTDNRNHDDEWLLADLAAKTVQDRIDYHKRLLGEAAITYAQHDDRIRRLVDTDGDNVADESVLVASGFNRLEEGSGAGILARGKDLYFTCIPKLWKLTDDDGDGKADKRVALSDGYGVRVAFRGHDLHGAILGPDGRLYFSIGDRGYHITTDDGRVLDDPASGAVFRCELDGSGLEVYATGLRNPQELAFNEVGDLFSIDNNSDSGDRARIVHLLEGSDTGWRMYYQYLPDRGPFNRERLWEPFHDDQPAYMTPPIINFTDGPSGLVYYPGTGFGDELKNKFLICDFRGGPANSGVRSFELAAGGATYQMQSEDQPIWTCLATDITFGPDGSMYVSDWVEGWNGVGKGRVYRIVDPKHTDSKLVTEVHELLKSDWTSLAVDALVKALSHIDQRVRLEAQWELANRGEHTRFQDVLAAKESSQLAKLHSIWGLGQIVRLNKKVGPKILPSLRPLLADKDPVIRAALISTLGEHQDAESIPQLTKALSDESERVRYFAAMSLAKLSATQATESIVRLLADNKNQDPAIRHSGIMYLATLKPAALGKLKDHPSRYVRRAAVVALRRKKAGELMYFLEDSDPLVVLEAARAIHDVPVQVAFGKLAALIDKDLADLEYKPKEKPQNAPIDTPLARRVLNANYRLGTAANAEKLAKYATEIAAPLEMRLEALDMLQNWETPDPRDRVLNDYRELKPRKLSDAIAALEPNIDLLSSSDAKVREKMIDVASRLGIRKIVPMLQKRYDDKNLGNEVRAAALMALSRLDAKLAVKLAMNIDMTSSTPLVPAGLDVLAAHEKEKSVAVFVAAIDNRDNQVRQRAWDILATIQTPEVDTAIAKAMEQYVSGKVDPEIQLNILEASKGRLTAELQKKLDDYNAALQQSDPLAKWLPSLSGGHAGKGSELFYNKTVLSCVRCHQIHRTGGNVGPILTTIGKQRDRKYLLESICLPNAKIAKGYETAVIANEDGTHSGIVKVENDEYIDLIKNDGRIVRIQQDEIEARKRGNSSMPADLIKHLSARELRDLIEFLANQKVDPRAPADVE